MQTDRPSLFTRDDTLLGVCAGLGEDLGFNPLPLRMAFGVLLLWNPVVILSIYAALGLVVFGSRKLYPNARAAGAALQAPAEELKPLSHENDEIPMAVAA